MANSWLNNTPRSVRSAQATWDAHIWGRQKFVKSFAAGGGNFATTVFAQSKRDALFNPWRRRHAQGSTEYMRRLRQLQSLDSDSPRIRKAIEGVNKAKPRGMGGQLLGAGLGTAFVALPAFTTEGPLHEKARGVTSGLGAWAGWEVGSKAGMGVGAAIGGSVGALLGPIGAAVGAGLGAAAGWLAGGFTGSIAGEELTDAMTRIPDRMVDKERNRRNLNWGAHTAPFQTQRAHTMRQQSLAAMNRGQMSARSLLGQEAVFVHR
jgi:hypothetical protein